MSQNNINIKDIVSESLGFDNKSNSNETFNESKPKVQAPETMASTTSEVKKTNEDSLHETVVVSFFNNYFTSNPKKLWSKCNEQINSKKFSCIANKRKHFDGTYY